MRSPIVCSQRSSHIPVLATALVVAIAGCQNDAQSPTAPEATPLAAAVHRALAFRQISAGHTHTCAVSYPDNRAYCWGSNWAGQIGDGSTTDRFLPAAVAGGLQFNHVSVGQDHSCGVTFENKAYCWGRNAEGQVGDGTFKNRTVPVAVVGGRNFKQVDAGSVHTCAIIELSPDDAYCWGANNGGPRPVLVLGGLPWRQLSAGNGHTCGVTTAFRAYCWGSNGRGQLGDGTTLRRAQPSPVAGGLRFRQVAAGGFHSCGVTFPDDGLPWGQALCWGYNGLGQLGDGTRTTHLRPTAIASQRTWGDVSTGYEHTCAVTRSQRAWCWGNNGSGRLGDGTTTNRLKPALVGEGRPFREVSAGTQHSCAISREHHGYCWGENGAGQVGVLPRGQYPSPVRVVGPM
jgi:alpha-tubulin suppressor-like RCC1 family protein